jgi:acetyl-CoA carboxylase carboxyltransferase component
VSTTSSDSTGTEAAKKSPRQLRREKEAAANREAWAPMQAELRARRAAMRVMGGPERVRKYMHDRGKLDARQRLDALFDPGTFREIGPLVGTVSNIPAEGFICGIGKVDGRR